MHRPIQRGLPGPALLAHVVSSKYCLHQPLYRQSQVYGFAGVAAGSIGVGTVGARRR